MDKYIQLSIENMHPNLRLINLYQCAKGFNSGPRILYDNYFLYVHKGKGRIIIGGKTFNSVSGDLYYCPPGTPNTIIADDMDPFLLSGMNFDFTLNHVSKKLMYPLQAEAFNPDLVTDYVNFTDYDGFPDRIGLYGDEEIHELIYKMIYHYNTRKKFWELYCNALMHTFIIAVVQHTVKRGPWMDNQEKANKIIEYLSQNYMHQLTNMELSQEFHYNHDYISKVVINYTGMTLKQYIIDLRIRAALNLLVYSDMSIKDIAVVIGYDNVHYFTRIFKNKTGFPPGYFRKKTHC